MKTRNTSWIVLSIFSIFLNSQLHAEESSLVDLGTLRINSLAYGVSGDGSVVVGTNYDTLITNSSAFKYTQSGGMVDLGTLAGDNYSYANGISADGSIIVGNSANSTALTNRAFKYTDVGGMVDLGSLAGKGVKLILCPEKYSYFSIQPVFIKKPYVSLNNPKRSGRLFKDTYGLPFDYQK
jgi:probable HAF family extracellular repeat protein